MIQDEKITWIQLFQYQKKQRKDFGYYIKYVLIGCMDCTT